MNIDGITVRKRRTKGDSFTADYLVERDGVLLAVCPGNQLAPGEPSIAEAQLNACIMADAFNGTPLPVGWRVETGGGNYRVHVEGRGIVAYRRHGYLAKENLTSDECVALAGWLSVSTLGT
jgi:hypothetical protein